MQVRLQPELRKTRSWDWLVGNSIYFIITK